MNSRRATKTLGDSSFVITVRAKPRSKVSSLEQDEAGAWVARLRAPPVDGKANAELIDLVAKRFGCPKTSITVVSGASVCCKLVKITGATAVRANDTA